MSIRQPHAERIMCGIKREEYRSKPTKVRGRVYIYASKKIDGQFGNYTLGRIIGSIEIRNCYKMPNDTIYAWILSNPKRLKKPLRPQRQPQPVFFYPFS